MDLGAFVFVLFVVAAVMRVDFIFYVFYVFAAVYFISRAWSRRALKQLVVRRFGAAHAFWGERTRVRVELRNRGPLPVAWLHVQETLPPLLAQPPVRSKALSLWPGESASFTYELDCRRRGRYELGPLRLTTGDILGTGGVASAEGEVAYLTVYPRILPLEQLAVPAHSPYATVPRSGSLQHDPARVAGSREYRPGDSIRHINWKASASQGTLQSKLLDPVISLDTVILLDMERAHYEAAHAVTTTELAISVAATMAVELARRRQSFAIGTNAADPLAAGDAHGSFLPLRSGQGHLMLVLELLGRIEAHEALPFGAFLERHILRLPWGCALFFVSGTGAGLVGHVIRLRRSGFPVSVMLVDYHADLSTAVRQLQQAGATVRRMQQSAEAARVVL